MTITRRLARPLLAAPLISGGIDTIRTPGPPVARADEVAPKVAAALGVPIDTAQLVRLTAGVQIGCGVLLAGGRLPRLAAAVLAASLVPATVADHRFWEESDPVERARQRIQFAKNLGLLGGLLLAAVDTEGAPSVAWRTRRAARQAGRQTHRAALRARQALPVGGP